MLNLRKSLLENVHRATQTERACVLSVRHACVRHACMLGVRAQLCVCVCSAQRVWTARVRVCACVCARVLL